MSHAFELHFTTLIWACPVAFALHVLEEAPRFTAWVNRFIRKDYTQKDYWSVHGGAIFSWFAVALLVSIYPVPWIVFLFFALLLAPGFFFNTVFHAGGTIVYGAYSPGVLTCLLLFLPLFVALSALALREGLIGHGPAAAAFVFAGVFHTVEVAYNTYGVNLLRRRR